ncbi:MAG TPA: cell division protein FtsH, partial [bacterium]|nr:cell division protein FtsH [bacterium]
VSFREHEAVFLGRDLVQQRTLSEETNREIDNEIKRILEQASRTAEKILQENRDKLDILVNKLLEYETLTTQQINEILGGNNGKESRQQSSD